jgi:hypothetical protein
MSVDDDLGWRDRAIAPAALGAVATGRSVFASIDAGDPRPLQMQVLVCLALQDTTVIDAEYVADASWLGLALRIDEVAVEELLLGLAERGLIVFRPYELDEDDEDQDEDGQLRSRGSSSRRSVSRRSSCGYPAHERTFAAGRPRHRTSTT